MKKTIYLFAAALALAGLSACDKNGNDPDTAEGSDARFMAIADRFVNHTVIPTYTSLSDYTEQLVEVRNLPYRTCMVGEIGSLPLGRRHGFRN